MSSEVTDDWYMMCITHTQYNNVMCLLVSVGDCLSQDQGAMMFGGQGTETTQVSIPNNVRTQRVGNCCESLTLSMPTVQNCCCLKGSAPYWSNPPLLLFDIRALWRSILSARCQRARMSKIENSGLDQYDKKAKCKALP